MNLPGHSTGDGRGRPSAAPLVVPFDSSSLFDAVLVAPFGR
ncbi:hypothetical protein ACFWDI_26955 [Streptomyces sp. NPDC060064]